MSATGIKRARKTVALTSTPTTPRRAAAVTDATEPLGGASGPLVFLPTLQGCRANTRSLPETLEDHVCDHLPFGCLFTFYSLSKGVALAAERLWARKRHLRCRHEAWSVLPPHGAQAYWAAAARCPRLSTIVIGRINADAKPVEALLRRHAPTLQVLELCDNVPKGVLAAVVRQCSQLHTLRLLYLGVEEGKAVAEALPDSCPLRALKWEVSLSMRAVRHLLARLTAADIRLEELELVGVCDPGLLAQISEHPLRVLHIDELAEFSGATLSCVPACEATIALPAALLKLQATLTDLRICYNPDDNGRRIALSLWAGLRRLHVEGDIDVVAAPEPASAFALRHLSISSNANIDWAAPWVRALCHLRALRIVDGDAATTFAAAVRLAPRSGALLPALRSLCCDGAVSLDRVLTLWPELVALDATNAVLALIDQPDATAPRGAPPFHHAHLRRLCVASTQPVVERWAFGALDKLDLLQPAGNAKPVAEWRLLERCLAAAAPTLRRLTITRTQSVAAASSGGGGGSDERGPPIALPRLQYADFGVDFDASRPEISAIICSAPSLVHLRVQAARDGAGMLVWLAALGARGALANLRHLHYATGKLRGSHAEREAHLRRALPLLLSCRGSLVRVSHESCV